MIYAERIACGRSVRVRDIEERDIEPILDYWYSAPADWLLQMGVDPARLPPREQRRMYFRSMLGADPRRAERFLIAAEHSGRIIGYALFNQIDRPRSCQAHLHILDPALRRQGLASQFFPHMIERIPALLGVEKLVFEPRAEHLPINAFLGSFRLAPSSTYIKAPFGISGEMRVNRYEVTPSLVASPSEGSDRR